MARGVQIFTLSVAPHILRIFARDSTFMPRVIGWSHWYSSKAAYLQEEKCVEVDYSNNYYLHEWTPQTVR